VSQLFDSLRRGRAPQTRANPARTSHGDAVLATLGYSPVRRSRGSASLLRIAAVLLAIAAIWIGWRVYYPASPPATGQRVRPPSIVARPNPPATHTGRVNTAPVTQAPPLISPRPSPTVQLPVPAPQPTPLMTNGDRPLRPAPRPIAAPPTAAAPIPRHPGPTESTPAPPTSNDFELALYYHRAGDFENALQHYRALLQKNEMDAQAHNNLGLLYQEKNLLQESARELQRAVLIEPQNASAHNNYGVTLLLQGRPDEAAAEFRLALGINPRSVDAMVNLALAERARNQLDVAKETLLKALTVAPRNAAAHYNLAQLYDQTNEAAPAIEHYRRFLETAGAEHAGRAAAVRARIAELSRTPE
jgi:Tfp pilus assembly protein PilF